ncbi:MAG: hypothetical protein QNK37_29375 [Acidobacteriota bacterium]|nr:hypothetical protein [Acidobacteriota bacterium]
MNRPNNPYMGPRPILESDGRYFSGRDSEADKLLSLVISERLVVLHGPRGCGKTSLVHARLVPDLRENGFAVLPVGYIDGPLPNEQMRPANRFVYNLLCRLHQGDGNGDLFTRMNLSDFLDGLVSEDAKTYRYEEPGESEESDDEGVPMMLIIDQFEWIAMQEDTEAEQADFFHQLAAAMLHEPNLWVLLCCDDAYLADITAFASTMADGMRALFHLSHLTPEEAGHVIQGPSSGSVPLFEPDAVTGLLDLVHSENRVDSLLLQICCYRLWDHATASNRDTVTVDELVALGEEDDILPRYFDETLEKIASAAEYPELELRTWCERNLVGAHGNRKSLARGPDAKAGMNHDVIREMGRHHLIAEETHTGGAFIKLAGNWMPGALQRANQRRINRRLVERRKRYRILTMVLAVFLVISTSFALLKKKPRIPTRSSPAELEMAPYNNALFKALLERGIFLLDAPGNSEAYAREALIDLLQAHELDPDHKRVRNYLVMAYERLGENAKAEKYRDRSEAE